MAGMNNLKDVSNAFRLQNVQVSGDRVKAGFDPPPVVAPATPAAPAPTPVVAPAPAAAAAPVTETAPAATTSKSLQATARRRRSPTSATILGNGDAVDTLG